MKTLLSLSLLSSICFVNAQINQYYKQIVSAEKCVITNKLDSALFFYELSYKHKKIPFAKDLNNAAIVAINLEKYNKANKYLKQLLQLGGSISALSEYAVFSNYFTKSTSGQKFVSDTNKIKTIYNISYRNQLKQLFIKDQYYRKKRGSANQYVDSIRKADAENITNLLNLIKTNGFPTEESVGIEASSLHTAYIDIVIFHQGNGEMQQYNFANILLENVKNGKLNNMHGYDLYVRNEGLYSFDYMRFLLVKVLDSTKPVARRNNYIVIDSSKWGFMPYNKNEIEKINSVRIQFYLDEYEIFMKKILFNEVNKEYRLSSMYSGTSALYTDRVGFEKDKSKLLTF